MTSAQPLPPVVGAPSPTVVYASIGSRIGAFLIDGVLGALIVVPGYLCLIAASSDPYQVNTGLMVFGLLLLLASPAWSVYQWSLVAKRGHTVGKRMVGIRVVDETNPQHIGWGRAFVRQLVLGLLGSVSCGILSLISILTANGHPKRQAWHDSAAHTVVIVDPASSATPAKRAVATPPTPVAPPVPQKVSGADRPSLASGAVVTEVPRTPAAPVQSSPAPIGLIQSVPGFASPERPVVPSPVPAPAASEQSPVDIGSEIDHATRASDRRAPRDRWQLRGEDGTQIGLSGPVLIGRAPEAREHPGALAVAVADPERSMSKTHAFFTIEGTRLEVEDWSSTNGTFVTRDGQEQELAPRVRTTLQPGDRVTLGDRHFVVESIG